MGADVQAMLLPRPRELRVVGAGRLAIPRGAIGISGLDPAVAAAATGLECRARPDRASVIRVHFGSPPPPLGDLGYGLTVITGEAGHVLIEAAGVAGARAGLQTLAQLLRVHPAGVPALRITDWPALATRGVMLDVSRCRIPTMDEFGRVIPLLASLKFNHIQLYTEHTFAYRDHREVWDGWDPITPEQARTLAVLCAHHGMALGANQNCFGHMRHWLEMPRYAGLAETHGEFDFYGMRRRGPFSLCPIDPASREFACGLLDELCASFGPDGPDLPFGPITVNIGCDETADIGTGRSRDAVAACGKGAVYAQYVASLLRHAVDRGWTPQFWADIALEHPDVLATLPREATALAWGYEPDSQFERWGRVLAESGRPWWICPGTSSWRSITGRTAERRRNIEAAARAGVAHGASGFMICDWGDVGHLQQWPVALAALAHAADAAWTGGAPAFDTRAASVHAFGEELGGPGAAMGPWLDELGDADELLRRAAATPRGGVPPLRNASALFSVLWPAREEFGRSGALGDADAWDGVSERLGALESRAPRVADDLCARELAHTIRWARCAARVGRAMAAGGGAQRAAVSDALAELEALEETHAALWMHRSRRGGLSRSREFWRESRERLVRSVAAPG